MTKQIFPYFNISTHAPCILYYFVLWQTNTQVCHKLSHDYMFRHYRVILWQLVFCSMTNKCTIVSHTATCFDTMVSSSDSL